MRKKELTWYFAYMLSETLANHIQMHERGHIYEGKWHDWDAPFLPASMPMLQGHTFFTSLRVDEGRVHCRSFHEKRLKESFDLLNLDHNSINDVWNLLKNFSNKSCSVRMTFILENEKVKSFLSYQNIKETVSKNLMLGLSERIRREYFTGDKIKWGNYAQDSLELKHMKDDGVDEVFWRDRHGNFSESSTSNLLFCLNGKILSPVPGPCVLKGVSLQQIEKHTKIYFKNIENLDDVNEVYLVNGIRGVRSVGKIISNGKTIWDSKGETQFKSLSVAWEKGYDEN